ncbi:MAG: hypothetical protein ABI763_03780 [Bacteroidota bacterium]
MLQCKIFSGNDFQRVEKEVNDFLHDHSKNIIHSVVQSASASTIQISVFYNVRTKAAKAKEAEIAAIAVPIRQGDMNSN